MRECGGRKSVLLRVRCGGLLSATAYRCRRSIRAKISSRAYSRASVDELQGGGTLSWWVRRVEGDLAELVGSKRRGKMVLLRLRTDVFVPERYARVWSAVAVWGFGSTVERAVGYVAGRVVRVRVEDPAAFAGKLSLLVVDVDRSAEVGRVALLVGPVGRKEGSRSWRRKLSAWLGTCPPHNGDQGHREDEDGPDGDRDDDWSADCHRVAGLQRGWQSRAKEWNGY